MMTRPVRVRYDPMPLIEMTMMIEHQRRVSVKKK